MLFTMLFVTCELIVIHCCTFYFILADFTEDHHTTPSQHPHKLAPLKPAPLRPSVRGDSLGSTPSPTILGSVQRYQHVQSAQNTSQGSGINANSNILNPEGMSYSHPVALGGGTRLETLEHSSSSPFPDFSGLGNPDNNAQSIPPSDLTRSLPTSAFSTGYHPRRTVSFDLSIPTESDVLAKSDGAVYLSSSG